MKAAGITLSTVGAGGGSNPFLEDWLRRVVAVSTTPEPGQHPGHLPQGDAAGLGRADRRGAVLPDPDLLVADPARLRRGDAPAARLQRHDGQGAARSWSPPVTTRSWRNGSTASVGRWPGPRIRPDAGLGTGLAGMASRASSASWCRGRSRARRPGASKPCSIDRGKTTLHVESVETDGSPRDFYDTSAVVVGPDLQPAEVGLVQVAPGVYEAALGEIDPGAYAVRVTQTRPARPSVARSGWSPRPPPSTASSARTRRSWRRCARRRAAAWSRRPSTRGADLVSTSRSTDLWPMLLVLALLLWPIDIALRRLGRTAGIRCGRRVGARDPQAPSPDIGAHGDRRGAFAARERATSAGVRAAIRQDDPALATGVAGSGGPHPRGLPHRPRALVDRGR